jgi:AraC-like DNA-binding protein
VPDNDGVTILIRTPCGRGVVRARRLARARKDLTAIDRSIWDAAHRWGFTDGGHFTRNFKGHYGYSSTDYRHANHCEPPPLTQWYTDLSRSFKLKTACSTML